ncbi:MAG: prepilin-type N-terminal cleavage/methylation domain-containing protein [Syntrophaceae bacterium]|nr:prepilin-type N-terminal cleavage/methylation domain-containing protein [Syntrophaceae bacterium]
MKNPYKRSGFTPIEMLAALFVLSLVLLGFGSMVCSVVHSTARSKDPSLGMRFAPGKKGEKNLYRAAEAGLLDARSRLQAGASGLSIHDPDPSNPNWTAFIGTEAQTIEKGYQSHNRNHYRYDRRDSALDYVVTIRHKVDGSGKVLKWGDSDKDGRPEENTAEGEGIYVITSEAYGENGATPQRLQIEAALAPRINALAALYAKRETSIQGASTFVQGFDRCGNLPLPGVLSMEGVRLNGNPSVGGFPSAIVEYSPSNIDVQYLVNRFKKRANFQYNVNSATLPSRDWGVPAAGRTQHDPSDRTFRNIVYFNTNGTYVRLCAGSRGCGVLAVEGDFLVHGGFQWYGIILVTGSITFTGGGDKNVTGAVMAGGMASLGLVEGGVNILFCSRAVHDQTNHLPPVSLGRREVFSESPEGDLGRSGGVKKEKK